MIEAEAFDELVAADLHGDELTEAEHQSLHGSLDKWHESLAYSLQDIDKQLTQRRATWLEDHLNTSKRVDYEKWKKGAVGYKLAVLSRLREVKAMIKARNMAEYAEKLATEPKPKKTEGQARAKHIEETQALILSELASIKAMLGRLLGGIINGNESDC